MRGLWKLKSISFRAPKTDRALVRSSGKKIQIRRFIGPACVLLVGVILGSIFSSAADANRYLSYFVHQYLIENHGGGFSSVAASAFLSAMTLQAIALFFSLSCIGAPVLLCIPFLRGVAIGCISACLYTNLGSRGLLANLILLWLPEVIQAGFLILFISVSMDTSISLFRLNVLEQSISIAPKLRRCLRCFIVSSGGLLLAALLEALLSTIFSPVLLEITM